MQKYKLVPPHWGRRASNPSNCASLHRLASAQSRAAGNFHARYDLSSRHGRRRSLLIIPPCDDGHPNARALYACWVLYNGESLKPRREMSKKELKAAQQKATKKAAKSC